MFRMSDAEDAPTIFNVWYPPGCTVEAHTHATDYTEIGLLWTNIGKRTAIWLPIVTVPQILALGFLFNYLS